MAIQPNDITPRVGDRYRWNEQLVTVRQTYGMRGRVLVQTDDGHRVWALIEALTEPVYPGMVVGYRGLRCEVTRVTRNGRYVALRWQDGQTFGGKASVAVTDLHEPPPLSERMQAMALDVAALLRDPMAATFGKRD